MTLVNEPMVLDAYTSACVRVAYHENKVKFAEEAPIVMYIDIFFVVCVLIFLCIGCLFIWGINQMMINIFYYCCCHCLLKVVIDWRNGQNLVFKMKQSINNQLQGDEEMAEVIAERINDLSPEELGDVSNLNEKELSEFMMKVRVNREKQFQYVMCKKRDKIISHKTQRMKLVSLADRMKNTIDGMKKKEKETFLTSYMNDMKHAMK